MDFYRVLSIAATVALYGLYRKYKAWKAARTEIPAYRNWRGEYVPDLKLKRIERLTVIVWVVFILLSIPISLYALGGPEMRHMLDAPFLSDHR